MTASTIKRLLAFCGWARALFSFGVVLSKANVSGMQSYEVLIARFHVCALTFNKCWGTVLFTTCFFTPASIMVGIYGKNFYRSQATCQGYQ